MAADSVSELLQSPSGRVGLAVATVAGAASLAYCLTRPRPIQINVDLNRQSVKQEDGSYLSAWSHKNGLLHHYYEDAKTLHQCLLRGKRLKGDGPFLGERTGPNRQFEWISYNEAYDRIQAFGSGLLQLGLKPGKESRFGIFATNRPEWVIADQACMMFSMVTVALYDTLGEDSVIYVSKLCDMSVVLCDTVERAQLMLKCKKGLPGLHTLILVEPLTPLLTQQAKAEGVTILTVQQIEEKGINNPQEPVPPKPDDLATICFTSGTTGDPKGAVLTHGNIIADIAAVNQRLGAISVPSTEDFHLSYLPLAHMYERVNIVNLMAHGVGVGFFSRDINLLLDDLQTLKPSIFPTVPRLLNRIRDKVMAGASASKLKSFLLQTALNSKLQEVKRNILRRNSVWDWLVLRKVRAVLGGNVTYISTGSAPLSPEVFDFTRCVFGCVVIEGYGQTEATAAVTVTYPGDSETGHVGAPVDCNAIKLLDVPELEYYSKDNKGEVCVKGANVMKEYFKNPEKTKEAFTADGWLRTGDVGVMRENGTLQIIDRTKHIFKLAQGEYVAPERIEAIYSRSKYVQGCFVDGNSLKHRPVAIVVPDPDFVMAWARGQGLGGQDMRALCSNRELKATILEDVLDTGKRAKLRGFEQVMDIYLEAEPFSVEKGLITPTFKNKRPQLRKYFAPQLASLYDSHQEKA